MPVMYRCFYDRKPGTVDGVFTVLEVTQDESGNYSSWKVFDRLPARSGQQLECNTSWRRGRSPIPYSHTWPQAQQFKIWLDPRNQEEFPSAPGGIGRFWPISNHAWNQNYTKHPFGNQIRTVLGLHPENLFRGSKGCIVLLWDTPERKAEVQRLFNFFRELIRKGVVSVELVVT